MNLQQINQLFREAVRSPDPTSEKFEQIAEAVIELYESGDESFRQQIKNRFGRVTNGAGQGFDAKNFDLGMARAFIADEVGHTSWDEFLDSIGDPTKRRYPIPFQYAIAALWRGDFTSLDITIGPTCFFDQIQDWFDAGYFADEPETFAEAFAAACWLGHSDAAAFLLDKGVDPYAGMRTGLSGFHWAASSGKLDVIKLLIERKVPMEIKSMYDSTVLGQALYSAANEHTDQHADIVKSLVEAGAHVWPGTWAWWQKESVPSEKTKSSISEILRKYDPENAEQPRVNGHI